MNASDEDDLETLYEEPPPRPGRVVHSRTSRDAITVPPVLARHRDRLVGPKPQPPAIKPPLLRRERVGTALG